jgi:hypothetical protein
MIFFGIILGLLLIAYENGISLGLLKKILCKLQIHNRKIRLNSETIRKYYCQWCGKARKHPPLKSIDGGKKWWDNDFKV